MSQEDIPRINSDLTAAAVRTGGVAGNEDYSNGDFFVARDFLGFLGESSPKVLDCSLLPNLVLKLFLAPATIISRSIGTGLDEAPVVGQAEVSFTKPAASGSPSYELNRIHLNCTVYGIMDGNYDRMVESKIVNEGFLEVPFKNYQTFFDGQHNNTSRFNLGCQSLDRLYAVWRNTNYNSYQPPVLYTGMKKSQATAGQFVATTAIAGTPAATDWANYGVVAGVPTLEGPQFNGEKYTVKAFDFPKPGLLAGAEYNAQFNINGTLYPQFQATAGDWLQITTEAMECSENQIRCRAWWDNHQFINAVRLNLPMSDKLRIISGLDTRSINLSGMFVTTGVMQVEPL